MPAPDISPPDREQSNKWLVLFIVAMNGFLIILDFSIVNISFPVLTSVFETDISLVLWVTVAFALIPAGLMPIFGKLADILGRKKIFLAGFTIFTAGLILCPFAQSIQQLIFFRLIQGVGAAMNMALSFAIVTNAFPYHERGKALGVMTSVFSVGPLIGFTISGALLSFLNWEALFYTRAPLCVLGILLTWRYLDPDSASDSRQKIDFFGAGFLFTFVTSLMLYLNIGGRQGFDSSPVQLLGITAVISILLFIRQEMSHESPIVDLKLYRSVPFIAGSVGLVVVGIVMSSQIFLLPFIFQRGFAYTPLEAGFILAALPVLHSLLAPVSGWLSDRFGTKPLCVVGMCSLGVGAYLMTLLSETSDLADVLVTFFFTGLGGGLFNAPNTSQLMGAASQEQLGSVGALATTMRQIAMSCAFVVAEVIFSARSAHHRHQLLDESLAPDVVARMALFDAFSDTMLLATILCLFGIIVFAVCRKPRRRVE